MDNINLIMAINIFPIVVNISNNIVLSFFSRFLISLNKFPICINYLFLICGLFLDCFINNNLISEFLLIIYITGLFGIVRSLKFKDLSVFPLLGKMSTIIYFIHLYVWTFYYTIMYNEKTYGIISFVVTTVASIIIALLFIFFKGCKKKKLLSLS